MAASVVHLGEIYHPDNKQLITIIPIGVSIHDWKEDTFDYIRIQIALPCFPNFRTTHKRCVLQTKNTLGMASGGAKLLSCTRPPLGQYTDL